MLHGQATVDQRGTHRKADNLLAVRIALVLADLIEHVAAHELQRGEKKRSIGELHLITVGVAVHFHFVQHIGNLVMSDHANRGARQGDHYSVTSNLQHVSDDQCASIQFVESNWVNFQHFAVIYLFGHAKTDSDGWRCSIGLARRLVSFPFLLRSLHNFNSFGSGIASKDRIL